MAFTFIAGVAGYNDATGTSLACASTLNVAAGDLIVAFPSWEDGTGGTLGCSDSGSNVCTMTAELGSSSSLAYFAFGYKISASANATATFVFTNATTRPARSIIVLQFRPDAGETVSLDPSTSNPSTAAGSGQALQSGDMTTAGTDTVVIGAGKHYNYGTWSSEQIGDTAADGRVQSNRPEVLTETWYRILTGGMSAGHAQVSTTSTSNEWVCGVIAFKAVSGGSAAVTGTATASITEADVVAGGKVLTITLTGETFIA
jgi:hypothetical protein